MALLDTRMIDWAPAGGVRIASPAFFASGSVVPSILGHNGRVFLGDGYLHGAQVDGAVTGGSWLELIGDTAPTGKGWDYLQDLFRMAVITSVGGAISGVARTSDDTDAIGVAAIGLNRHAYATGRKGWSYYGDFRSLLGALGFGIEQNVSIEVRSEHGASDPHKAPGQGLVQGIRLMAGSDAAVFGRSYGVPAGIFLGDNGAKFLSGLVFGFNALLRDGEEDNPSATGWTDGNAHAIRMAYRHMLSWSSRDPDVDGVRPEVFSIASAIQNSAVRMQMLVSDGGLAIGELINPASNLFVVAYQAAATAHVRVEAATGSGAPLIRAANALNDSRNLHLQGQNGGLVAWGAYTAGAPPAADGFIRVVTYDGDIRDIPCSTPAS
ncbi:hypothetical protein [Palleronia pelagia]|uniref:Uncharacterized protein n=1 Tax=Palleronia pelagia TaxID=387096 RepID=A0A1H8HUT7_9RHOB|nr:hypothetical protein [Palleronia pelagia]SEN59939.1 hypothetical protein SAMN04488011_10512 [Palleronia pelagia]